MANIEIIMKDGEIKKFKHFGRAGGSYTKRIKYEGGMAIVTDEWNKEIAIPVNDIKEVISTPTR